MYQIEMRLKTTLVFLSLLLVVAIVKAATDTDTVTVAVNVSSVLDVTVTPDRIEFLNVQPGSASSTFNTLEIQNTGSVNITKVYASVDSESSNPLGTGNPASYYAGGFLVMKNSTESTMQFVGRKEWNETSQPSGMTPTTGAVSWGFFRNASSNYLWDLVPDSEAGWECNGSATGLKIKTVADTGANRDMSVDTVSGTNVGNNTNYAVFTFDSGPLADYCVATYKDCTYLYIYVWDWSNTYPACSDRRYLREGTVTNPALAPTETMTVTTNAWVPKGVPSGNTTESTLTITVADS